MKMGNPRSIGFAVLALGLGLGVPSARAQDEPVSDEYRITLFPNLPLKERVTGFGYLGYVTNPDKDYQTYYVGFPGVAWTVKPSRLQIWGGLIGTYTNNQSKADKLELRPFVGLKSFVPNNAKINLYNFSRYELRAIRDQDTDAWTYVNRFRSRFGAEIPLTSRERAWQKKTFYALVDVEPFYRSDKDTWDPVRVRGGLAYIFAGRCRAEFIYHMQFTRPDPDGSLKYTDNIFRLNVKIGLTHAVLPHLLDADIDE
jgi:hypothetical protein